jgi:Uma2 family endonuclease
MARMGAVNPRVSFAELQDWPDTMTSVRYELYDGEVILVATPFPRHQRVAMHVGSVLAEYEAWAGGLVFDSPIDIVFSEYDVVEPDVTFFRQERRHLVDMMAATQAAPDLVVEVLSRSTEARDRGRKMDLLARYGVPEYWIVDPVKNTLEIYALHGAAYAQVGVYDGGQEVMSSTLPGLSFSADRIFRE